MICCRVLTVIAVGFLILAGPAVACLTYAAHLAGREKVGVAGRTGCGKSTLMMALKRVMEPSGGRVLIDGVDIAAVPLFDLRSRLALVPQACQSYPYPNLNPDADFLRVTLTSTSTLTLTPTRLAHHRPP